MNIKNKVYLIALSTMSLLMASCDDFLSEPMDNRTEIDTPEKLEYLLRSAYGTFSYSLLGELASDNTDDYGENNPYTERKFNEMATWSDNIEEGSEGPDIAWQSYYSAIASANQGLAAIEEMGGGKELDCYKSEALLCRAYAHFMLANLFCMPYGTDSNERLGLTYITAPETTLNPEYKRESLEATYQHIKTDIEEGLKLIDDSYMKVPKYHFNRNAAYAFASRFYLYLCKDNTSEEGKEYLHKSIEYAEKILGNNPASMLRNTEAFSKIGPPDFNAYPLQYIKVEEKANLMLQTAITETGAYWSNYAMACRFTHGYLLSQETFQANAPWGNSYNLWNIQPFFATGANFDKFLIFKLPYIFEYKDPVSQTGYPHTVYAAFTSEEVLFNWAEAKVLLGGESNYKEAVNYLNIWAKAWMSTPDELTVESINNFYENVKYYTVEAPTIKKELSPSFTVSKGTQENMIHCILHARRLTFIHEGLRWFDVKRYGITVYHRTLDSTGRKMINWTILKKDDPRRAIQIPQNVIGTGYTANPR